LGLDLGVGTRTCGRHKNPDENLTQNSKNWQFLGCSWCRMERDCEQAQLGAAPPQKGSAARKKKHTSTGAVWTDAWLDSDLLKPLRVSAGGFAA